MCSGPYRQGVAEYGCGQCIPCRMNRRRLWTARLMLESRLHAASWFVTLTYRRESLPANGSVSPVELQLFMRKLRKVVYPEKVRFYGVGEYGDRTWRPHYHVALFGLSDPNAVASAWTKGHVHVGFLTPESASYIVSYVTKRMTAKDDERLGGRGPEFARMSLRPGIGAGVARSIVDSVGKSVGWDVYLGSSETGVPSSIRWESKLWPLGRYIRRKIREELGLQKGESVAVLEGYSVKLQEELCKEGAFVKHEGKRKQAAERARVLNQISRSKKGIGL